MRNFLLLLVLCCTCFMSCSDNDDLGITDIKLPDNEQIWKTGDIITIQGKGFTTNDEIWLYSNQEVTVKSYNSGIQKIKAEIIKVTEESIQFLVPKISGKQTIILIQDGQEYTLGVLSFTEQAKLIHKIIELQGDEKYETFYTYDDQGRVIRTVSINTIESIHTDSTYYEYEDYAICSAYWDYQSTAPDTSMFFLNKNKLIEKVSYGYPEESSNTYQYTDNQLTGIENESKVIWSAGNIIKLEAVKAQGDTYNFTYLPQENKANLDLTAIFGDFDLLREPILMSFGYFGQKNKNLLSGYSYGKPVNSFSFEYTFDDDNYVKTITEYLSFNGENKKLHSTITIEYQ